MSGLIKYLLAQAAIKGGKKINEMMEEEPQEEMPPPHPLEESLLGVLPMPMQPKQMTREEQLAVIEQMQRDAAQRQQQ